MSQGDAHEQDDTEEWLEELSVLDQAYFYVMGVALKRLEEEKVIANVPYDFFIPEDECDDSAEWLSFAAEWIEEAGDVLSQDIVDAIKEINEDVVAFKEDPDTDGPDFPQISWEISQQKATAIIASVATEVSVAFNAAIANRA